MPLLLLEASIIIHGPVLVNAKRKYSMQRLGDIAEWGRRRFLNCCLS